MTRVSNFISQILFTKVEDAKQPDKDLVYAVEALNKLRLKWFIAFGTALGFYRDKDFIPGDTDIDIAILVEDDNVDFDDIEEAFSDYEFIRMVTSEGDVHQLVFQGEDGFIIDLVFFYKNDKGWYSYCEDGHWQDREEVIGDLKKFKTKYAEVFIPDDIEEYLKDRYGDWETPKHGAITSSIKA